MAHIDSKHIADSLQSQNGNPADVIDAVLREKVADVMVKVHLIQPELARYHVAAMPSAELRELWEMYIRQGVAKPLPEAERQQEMFG